ncbi:putative transposase domain protein [Bacteroides fragilis str. 3986 N(B)22]|nr:putative transposase domain protein [Bacteroides fragilis str. 3988 T1]EYA28960.1 putative transposase domain protein [Bacteroides fragilis str. 1009-4-F \
MKKDHMKNGQLKPTYKYRLLQRSSSLQIRKLIGKPEIRQLLFLF